MRVGVLAYLLHEGASYRTAGVSTYIYELLRHLPGARPDVQVVALVSRDAPAMCGVENVTSPLETSNPLARILWEQIAVPLDSAARRFDVLHGTVNVVPLAARPPSVVTVHDLSFVRFPERLPRAKALYLRSAVSLSLRRAASIIAVSARTRQDVIDWSGVPEEKITVVHSGVDPAFRPLPAEEVTRFRSARFGGRPYILHVGTLEPRKNLDVLIRAFSRLTPDPCVPHVLALVGAEGWLYEDLYQLVRDLHVTDRVRFIGHVPRSELPLWYNGADLFVYPSAYEGFGLPVLEALACGVPTITSAASAMLEVASTACLPVSPGSEEDLQDAITRMLNEGTLRMKLRAAGIARAAIFTWERTARETLAVYERAAGASLN